MMPWLRRDLVLDGTVAWDECATAMAGRALASRTWYDFIVLERDLLDEPALPLASELRDADAARPIVMLADRGSDADVVAAIDAGVDEYIIRPVPIIVVRAHLRRLLRRSTTQPHAAPPISIGAATIDLGMRTLAGASGTTSLTAKEVSILACLLDARQQIVSRGQLLERVWGFDFDPGTSVFDVALLRLRRKLSSMSAGVRIESRRGLGFRLAIDEQTLNRVKGRRNSGEQNVSLR